MMLVQTQHVIEILTGRDSGWNAQRRRARRDRLERSWRIHWVHLVIGMLTGVIAFLISPTLLAWLTPTLAGLLLAMPLSKMSGSVRSSAGLLGWFRVLRTPEEKHAPPVIKRRDELLAHAAAMPHGRLALPRAQSSGALRAHHRQPAAPAESRGHPDPHRLTAEQQARRREHAQ